MASNIYRVVSSLMVSLYVSSWVATVSSGWSSIDRY